MPEPCPSCPETRCSPRHHLPTVYRACRQLSPFNYLTVPPLRPPPSPVSPGSTGTTVGGWMSWTTVQQEWAAGGIVLSQTLGVAAPSTFSLHRIHPPTFRRQTILPCRDDHPPAHTHSHTHTHQPQELCGRRNSSNKAICCPPRCYGNWADVHSGLKCFPWIPSAGGGFVCRNASQELTRCVRVSRLPLSITVQCWFI